MYIITGLGNPTKEYEKTRHNVGFDAIDVIAKAYNIKLDSKKHKAISGTGMIEGYKVVLVKPQTYMNLSGESVKEFVSYFNCEPETELIVLYDDIDLEVGQLRIRKKGSAGGHNGIKNIIAHLGTENFLRVKIGVGQKPQGSDLVNHVLGRFSKEDRSQIEDALLRTTEAVKDILTKDVETAMNLFNKKVGKE